MRPIALCAKIAKKQDGFANQDEQQQLTTQNIKRYFPSFFYFSGIQEKRQHSILKKEHVLTIELLIRFHGDRETNWAPLRVSDSIEIGDFSYVGNQGGS